MAALVVASWAVPSVATADCHFANAWLVQTLSVTTDCWSAWTCWPSASTSDSSFMILLASGPVTAGNAFTGSVADGSVPVVGGVGVVVGVGSVAARAVIVGVVLGSIGAANAGRATSTHTAVHAITTANERRRPRLSGINPPIQGGTGRV